MTSTNTNSRHRCSLLDATKKLAKTRSDIFFMSKCKELGIIPKGLTIKNPLRSTFNTALSRNLCHQLSCKLRNHLISIFYNKQRLLVDILEHAYNDWMIFDGRYLMGVPSFYGAPLHLLISISSKKFNTRIIPCTVEILTLPPNAKIDWNMDDSEEGCLQRDKVVFFSLRFAVEEKNLIPAEKIKIIQTLNLLLEKLKLSNRNKLAFENPQQYSDHIFLTGEGNIDGPLIAKNNVVVSWPIACRSDGTDLTEFDELESFVKNGSIAELTGYDVIEWRMDNRDPSPPYRYLSRVRRNLDKKFGSDTRTAKNCDIFKTPDGWSKVSNNKIKKSPVIEAPMVTPYFPDPSKRPMLSQSTPNLYEFTSNLNLPPQVNAGMEDFVVHQFTYFERDIPRDVFYDLKEGNTHFSFLVINETCTSNDPWLMLDQRKQVLYGVSPPEPRSKDSYNFSLTALDRKAISTNVMFRINTTKRPRPTNHRISLCFSKFDHSLGKKALNSKLAKLLADALDQNWRSVSIPGHYTFIKVDRDFSKLIITWFDNSLGNSTLCDRAGISQLSETMIGRSFDNITDEAIEPRIKFKKQFRPGFAIKSVKILLFGSCLNKEKLIINNDAEELLTTKSQISSKLFRTKIPFSSMPLTQESPLKCFNPITISNLTPKILTRVRPSTYHATLSIQTTLSSKIIFHSVDSEYVITLNATVGKILVAPLQREAFSSNNFTFVPFRLMMVDKKQAPRWIGINRDTGDLVLLLLPYDLALFSRYNSTHEFWRSKFCFFDENGVSTYPISVRVLLLSSIALSKNRNHRFRMIINNWNYQEFTATVIFRVARIIQAVFGDPNTDEIFVEKIEPGSVVITWRNSSITNRSPCPRGAIAMATEVLYDRNQSLKPAVSRRFKEFGLVVDSIHLVLLKNCLAPSPPFSSINFTDKIASPNFSATIGYFNSGRNENGTSSDQIVADGSSTQIIIGTTAIVCSLIIITIVVFKWRAHSLMKKKMKSKNTDDNWLQGENAAAPLALPRHSKNDFQLKPNSPVLLNGEDYCVAQAKQHFVQEQRPFLSNDCRKDLDRPKKENLDQRPAPPPYLRVNSSL